MSYDQISEILGVSPARVRQIEQRALEKMRRALVRQGITVEDVREVRPQGDVFELHIQP